MFKLSEPLPPQTATYIVVVVTWYIENVFVLSKEYFLSIIKSGGAIGGLYKFLVENQNILLYQVTVMLVEGLFENEKCPQK